MSTEVVQPRSSSPSRVCPSCAQQVDDARCTHCGVATRAGRWTVERVLAQSAHSRVYLARDEAGREVALKELHFALVPGPQEVDAFEREATLLEALQHPAIPRFVERFTEGSGVGLRLYLATEFVRGESLADRLKRGPLPEAEVLTLGRSLLRVLVDLQQRSPAVFHRDLKPANVMFREDGQVVLVDFGSARPVDASRTHRSTLVGTFGYMPPEQLGGTVDRSSDVFALGATLLHAVTGRPPAELLQASMALAIPSSVTPRLRAWLLQAVSLDRTRRFADARAALAALDDQRVPVVQVAPAQTGGLTLRTGLLVGALAFSVGAALVSRARNAVEPQVTPVVTTPQGNQDWFSRVKSGCNNLEVRGVMARTPPPPGADGAGYGAGCYALAARYDDARRLIEALPTVPERQRAAWRVFEICHPVADQGDDGAAGPMMELVLDFWPENYQALYHAGIAEYAQGDTARARQRLEDFLAQYKQDDFFTQQAKRVLDRIARGQPAEPGEALGRH